MGMGGGLLAGGASLSAETPQGRGVARIGANGNRLIVSPQGPEDGGDFGPLTPGTRTSGLQEAFDAAKAQRRDLYISGGSWTIDQDQPVVYVLHETLRIPWMQDFRMDSGHCVIHHAAESGDAVVIDSQMSCSFRFGLIVTVSDGAVVRMRPSTAGPDRFRVITASDFHFAALVGGGGAWPGGEAFDSELNTEHEWKGTGLLLDAEPGPILTNLITATEVVGCAEGIHFRNACTDNFLDAPLIHLCRTHLQLGDPGNSVVSQNRVRALLNSEGIPKAVGARLFGHDNLLELTFGQMGEEAGLIFEEPSFGNLVTCPTFPHGITNRANRPTNRVVTSTFENTPTVTPAVPPSGEAAVNRHPFAVEIRVVKAGRVHRWTETSVVGVPQVFDGELHHGQTMTLNPGEGITFDYDQPPRWMWKGLLG